MEKDNKFKWTENKMNENVLEKVKEKRMIIKTLRERQKNWIELALRSDSLLQTVWKKRMKSKKEKKDLEQGYLTG